MTTKELADSLSAVCFRLDELQNQAAKLADPYSGELAVLIEKATNTLGAAIGLADRRTAETQGH